MNAHKKPDVILAIESFIDNPQSVVDMYRDHPDAELGAAFLFSIRLEEWIADDSKLIRAWSEPAWEIIEEEMPDACEKLEPGDEIEPFADAIRDIYERAMQADRQQNNG